MPICEYDFEPMMEMAAFNAENVLSSNIIKYVLYIHVTVPGYGTVSFQTLLCRPNANMSESESI